MHTFLCDFCLQKQEEIYLYNKQTKYAHECSYEYLLKTSQELQMLSSVTINCQVTKIVMNSGSQLSVL